MLSSCPSLKSAAVLSRSSRNRSALRTVATTLAGGSLAVAKAKLLVVGMRVPFNCACSDPGDPGARLLKALKSRYKLQKHTTVNP